MSNLTPTASFDDVAQLETTTVALGGAGAPMNVQAQALLNRTQYLYVRVNSLAAVATSGDYNSLINRPALGSAAYQLSSAFATAAQGAKADGAAQASSLAAVATSGAYGDLTGKPFATDAPSDGNIYGRKNGGWVVSVLASPFINPMTTAGDIIVGGASGAPARLAKGADGTVLTMVAGAEAWSPPVLGTAINALSIASGVVNIDCSLGDYFTLALTANVTSITFSNLPAAGKARTIMVRMRQDSTGARTVALPSSFKAITGSDTAVQSPANAYTILAISTFDQGARWEYSMKGGAA